MAVDLGEVVQRDVAIRNAAGVAVDADATPTYAITLPDGTAGTAPGVAHGATGEYFVLYPTTTPGRHNEVWTATVGGVLTRYTSSFRVRSGGASLLDLPEARRLLGVGVDPIRDEDIRDDIEAATADVERATGYACWRRTVTAERHVGRLTSIVLRTVPVVAVTSLTDAGVTQPADSYEVDEFAGVVQPVGYWRGPVTVTYTVGEIEPSADVLGAVRLALKARWRLRGGASGAPARTGADPLDAQLRAAIDRLPHAPAFA